MRNMDYKNTYDGQMLKNRLLTIQRVAASLEQSLEPSDVVPKWTIAKIATAQDRLTTAMQYLQSKMQQQQANPHMGMMHNPHMGMMHNPHMGFFFDFFSSQEERTGRTIGSLLGLVGGLYLSQDRFKGSSNATKLLVVGTAFAAGREVGKLVGQKLEK